MKNLRRLGAGLALLLALVLVCHRAGAVVLEEGKGFERPIELSENAEVLLDPSNRLTIDDVLKPPFESGFTSRGLQQSVPRSTSATIWIRLSLSLEAGAADDWVVQLLPSWLDDIKVYAGNKREAHLVAVLGDRHPFSERVLKTNLPAFPVSIGTAPQTYYLQIRTHGQIPLVLHAWKKAGLEKAEAQRGALNLLLAGGVGALICMLLIFWAFIRDSIYFVFALLIGTATLIIFAMQGYGSSVLFPNDALWADRFVDVATCLYAASAALFVCRFFDYRSHSVVAARVMDGVAIFFAGLIPLAALGLLDPAWWWITTLVAVLAALNNVLLIWIVVHRRKREDLLVVPLFLLVTTIWLVRLGIQQGLLPIDHSLLERPVIQYLQMGNMLLLSIAMANRLFNIELQRKAEQRKAFASMQIASQALEDRSRQQEFVAVISHEFRTPLAIITAVSHALEVSPSGEDSRVKGSVKKIRQAVQRLTALIENLLLDDALESSRSLFENDRFDLRDVLQSAQNNCLPEDRERLEFSIPDEVLTLRGSQARIEMLLWNIIQNALKYSRLQVKVSGRIEGGFLVLDILNFGDPISKPEQARLFDRYFRGAQSSRVPGSGLGLHISRSIARQHGGAVDLVSSDAEGTVFRLSLPLDVDTGVGDRP